MTKTSASWLIVALALGGCTKNTNESRSHVPEVPVVVFSVQGSRAEEIGPFTITKPNQWVELVETSVTEEETFLPDDAMAFFWKADQDPKTAAHAMEGFGKKVQRGFSMPPGRYLGRAVMRGKWRLTITETATPPR